MVHFILNLQIIINLIFTSFYEVQLSASPDEASVYYFWICKLFWSIFDYTTILLLAEEPKKDDADDGSDVDEGFDESAEQDANEAASEEDNDDNDDEVN